MSGAQRKHVTGSTPDRKAWPPEDIRRITDALGDGLLISDGTGRILYLNPAGEELLGWENSELIDKPFDVLVGRKYDDPDKHFGDLITHDPLGLIGKRLDVTLVRGDGKDVRVDLMLSVGVSRSGGSVVIAVIRAHDAGQFQRLSTLTRQLLDVLTASDGVSPVEALLDVLGRRLGWDVTALWGLEADGSLICRGVWTTPDAPATAFVEEKRLHPHHDSGDLAKLAMERGEPLWFTDLGSNDRFTSEAIRTDGLTSACAFPIQYAGHYLGAVKMMSRAQRGPDPDLVELIAAAGGHIGEILHALEQTAERERLLAELEETRLRLQFLLRANRIVSNATGYVDTLERLAEVAVPTLGDLCLIDVLDDGGQIRRLASRHADPTKKHLADELKGRYAPDPRGGHPSAEVMTTGISRWSAEMNDQFLRATTHDARHFAILKELGFTSYMTVPLQIDGHARGTVTLVSAGSGRRYSMRELKGAEELASQIAGVVERARVLDRELAHLPHPPAQPASRSPARHPWTGGRRPLRAGRHRRRGGRRLVRRDPSRQRGSGAGGRRRAGPRHGGRVGDGPVEARALAAPVGRHATGRGPASLEPLSHHFECAAHRHRAHRRGGAGVGEAPHVLGRPSIAGGAGPGRGPERTGCTRSPAGRPHRPVSGRVRSTR